MFGKKRSNIIVGLDVGQQKDPSTICALQRDKQGRIWVVALEKLPLGYSYEQQVAPIKFYLDQINPAIVAIDATGTSRGLSELLLNPDRTSVDIAKKIRPVIFTSGFKENMKDNKQWTIPKTKLITAAATVLTDLYFAEGVNPANIVEFQDQLQRFSMKQSASANTSYGKDNVHDDWVTAFALAAFVVRSKKSGSPASLTSAASYAGQIIDPGPVVEPNNLRNGRPEGWGQNRRGYASIYNVDLGGGQPRKGGQNRDGSWSFGDREDGWPDRNRGW